jgi:CubicO group peptidase (beta-lactamase class C family)
LRFDLIDKAKTWLEMDEFDSGVMAMTSLLRRDCLKFFGSGLAVTGIGLDLMAPQKARSQEARFSDPKSLALDALIAPFMRDFDIPGLAIGVVHKDRPPFLRTYGIRRLGGSDMVNEHTLFGVASNTKALTAAALMILVERKKLDLDASVISILPRFRLIDKHVTALVSVRDLITHRTGLPLGAGDLMLFPLSDHSRMDIFKGVQHLKKSYPFRSGYDYNNTLYAVAGLVIEKITGQKFEDFITKTLLEPLGMKDSVMGMSRVETDNIVGRHARMGPPVRGIGPVTVIDPEETDAFGPAAGLVTSVHDGAIWLKAQLNNSVGADGKWIWSEESQKEMWRPQVVTGSSMGPNVSQPHLSVISAYGLGWFIQDYRGHRLISHSGGLAGQVTQHALLPDQDIGVIVYTNTEDGISSSIRNALLDHVLGVSGFDWHDRALRKRKEAELELLDTIPKPSLGTAQLAPDQLIGRYRDAWYGDVVIAKQGDDIIMDFTRTRALKGKITPFGTDRFLVQMLGRFGEDVLITPVMKGSRIAGLKLKAYSPWADFSFDFHDLDLRRVSS